MLLSPVVGLFLLPVLLLTTTSDAGFIGKPFDGKDSSLFIRARRSADPDSEPLSTGIPPKAKLAPPQIYSLTVISNVKYRYAETVVSNRVANPANESQEISFTVTLPETAFISEFLMIVKDNVYKAYVKEKEEAKKDYQAAVDRGDSAGHVELSARDSNVFTVSVNVEALNKVTFNLTYEQLLKRTLSLYEDVISINPGQVVKTLFVQVNIEESSNITELHVPDLKTNNEIDNSDTKNKLAVIEKPAGNKATVTWNPNAEQQAQISESGPNGQFIVQYDVDRISQPSQILVDEGYFVHFYAPNDLKTLRKHVIFTLDVSGSMQGRKIEQLKEALLQILGDIAENDFFTIILFSDSIQLWTLNGTYGEAYPTFNYNEETTTTTTTARPEIERIKDFIIPATPENVAKAKEFAKTLNDTGGTNIIGALRKSLEISQWGQKNNALGAEPLIIFLTDGQPNVEMSDTEEIIKAVRKQNIDKYAIFSLAFGDGADYNFLRKLSLSNNGFARNIYVASDTALQLKNFYKQVASPLLSKVTFQYIPGQVQENSTTREKFSNLFAGSELVVAGKLADGSDTLAGNISGIGPELQICIFPMPPIIPILPRPEVATNRTFGHLEKLWAYLYIQELLDKDAVSDEKNSTFKQEALRLSLKYGFVTPLTSLVVVKPNETVAQGLSKDFPSYDGSVLTPFKLSHPAAAVPYSSFFAFGGSSSSGLSGFAKNRLNSPYPPPPALQIPYVPPYYPSGVPLTTTFSVDSSFYDMSAVESGEYTTTPPLAPVNASLSVNDITWLNGTEVKFPSSNNTYSVAKSDLPNAAYQLCLLPDKKQAHCRHLAHCVLPNIIASFEDFIPYGEQCIIDARFVGICCPEVDETTTTLSAQTSTASTDQISTVPTSSAP